MAIQRIITWICPTGNFSSGREANLALQAWQGPPFSENGGQAVTLNTSQYFSQPQEFTWDNQTKELQQIMTFPDQTALDNFTAARNVYVAGHQDPVETIPTWKRLSRVETTV